MLMEPCVSSSGGYGHQLTGLLFGSSLFSLFSLVNIVKTKCRTFGWRGFKASMNVEGLSGVLIPIVMTAHEKAGPQCCRAEPRG